MNATLVARGVTKSYRGAAVLAGIDLALSAGEAAVVLGASGSGKTTLLSILGGRLRADAGEVWLDGEPVRHGAALPPAGRQRTRIGFVAQQIDLAAGLAIEENLALEGEEAGLGAVDAQARACELLVRLGLADQLGKSPEHLSAGQRQRVAIARALVHRPAVLLADDPTAALDWGQARTVVDLLVAQARVAGAAVLVTTHDARWVPRFDRVLVLNLGRLQERSSREMMVKA